MCAVVDLPAGVTIPMSALENVVWNNPHGYGLIIMKGKTDTKLEVIKNIEEGGTQPETIHALLEKYKKYQRFLHLRWKTEGDISEDNLHPFLVYDKDGTVVWFMHNGTLHEYKPIGADTRSDSLIFATNVLKPLIEAYNGNYLNDFAKKTLGKFWAFGNKGILISNKYNPLILNPNDWKDIKVKDENDIEVTFRASNDTYFDALKRGYEFDKREEARKAEEAKRNKSVTPFPSSGTTDWPLVPLKDIDLKANQFLDLKDIFCEGDLYTEEGTAALANLTAAEIQGIAEKDVEQLIALFVHVTGNYKVLWDEYLEINEKHERATKRIADIVQGRKVG